MILSRTNPLAQRRAVTVKRTVTRDAGARNPETAGQESATLRANLTRLQGEIEQHLATKIYLRLQRRNQGTPGPFALGIQRDGGQEED